MGEVKEHESAYSDMQHIHGFIEVFQYEDGAMSMAIKEMSPDAIRIAIAELKGRLSSMVSQKQDEPRIN